MSRPRFHPRAHVQRVIFVAATCLIACGVLVPATALGQVPPVGARADVRDVSGRTVTTAEFRDGRGEVLVTFLFPNPPTLTGTHGVRIHAVGRCDPPDFLTAGPGFNPTGKKHGRQNPEGPQVGDLPNVNFAAGLTTYNTSAPGASLGTGPGSLLGPNRSAMIVYAAQDDQVTDPDGNAGARIACGVITAVTNAPAAAAQPTVATVPRPTVSLIPVPAAAQQGHPPPAVSGPLASPVAAQANPAASALPSALVAKPSPVVAQPTAPPPTAALPTPQGNSGTNPVTAFVIAVLGVGLMAAGWLLRRSARLS